MQESTIVPANLRTVIVHCCKYYYTLSHYHQPTLNCVFLPRNAKVIPLTAMAVIRFTVFKYKK